MKFPSPVAIQWIAELIGASILGNNNAFASGINEIHKVEEGDLVFVDHPKYYKTCIESAASFIIINQVTSFPENKSLLVVSEPFEAYLKIVQYFITLLLVKKMAISHSDFRVKNIWQIGRSVV